jgi:hypothetical protein
MHERQAVASRRFVAFGLSSAFGFAPEFLKSSAASQMMIGYCGVMAPRARVTALMKNESPELAFETDAEIPVFVLVSAIGRKGARNKCRVFARNFATTVSLGKTNDLLAGHSGFEFAFVNLHRRD